MKNELTGNHHYYIKTEIYDLDRIKKSPYTVSVETDGEYSVVITNKCCDSWFG